MTDVFDLEPPTLSHLQPFPEERFMQFLSVLKINTKDFGLIPFQLLGTQKYVLRQIVDALDRGISHFIILKARQLGMSTFFIALDLFWAMEHPGLTAAFVTHTEQSRDQFRAAIEIMFAQMPKTHRIRYVRHNRLLLILRNGSLFSYLVAGTREASRSGLGRSGAYNFAHSTEVAFYGAEDDLKNFKAAQSAHYPHRLYIDESTANGFNFFYDAWEEAKDDPTICRIFVGWWLHDHYQFRVDDPRFLFFMPDGKDSKLTALERRHVRAVKDQFDFTISLQQMAWYRWKLESEYKGDQAKMDEDFPFVEDDAFVATGSKFFTVESLTDATREAKRYPFKAYRYRLGLKFEEMRIAATRDPRAELRVWEEPSPHGVYVVACDPAYGSSDEGNRSVINVSRCFADRLVQVAEFASPSPSTYQCAWVLAHLAGYYGGSDVTVILELSGPGQVVYQELLRLRADIKGVPMLEGDEQSIRNPLANIKHYLYNRVDSMSGEVAMQWRMSHDLKRRIMFALKDAVELRTYILNSVPMLEECRRIINDDGDIHAEGSENDDRVIAGALALEAYRLRIVTRLRANGQTFAAEQKAEAQGGRDPIDRVVINYMRRMKIVVPERT